MKDSSSYPALVMIYKSLNIKLNKFESMPMHMCFLGCTKKLISKAHITVYVNLMQRTQQLINSISIDLCMSMSFSVRITRLLELPYGNLTNILPSQGCLFFYFAPLEWRDVPKNMMKVIKAFNRVIILWFCLRSSNYGGEKVSSSKNDNHMKLSLSSRRTLCVFAKDNTNKNKENAKKKRHHFTFQGLISWVFPTLKQCRMFMENWERPTGYQIKNSLSMSRRSSQPCAIHMTSL